MGGGDSDAPSEGAFPLRPGNEGGPDKRWKCTQWAGMAPSNLVKVKFLPGVGDVPALHHTLWRMYDDKTRGSVSWEVKS